MAEPGGIVLNADAPAFISFETNAFSGTEYVPFVVFSTVPGDSLGIYGPGGVLWSQPLSDFDLDTLYFADIPAESGTSPDAPIMLTYYINSDDNGSASVWFPTDVEAFSSNGASVPEPSSLCLIGLGLALVELFRRKRMQ